MIDNIFPQHYQECKQSFIDDDLIRLNIKSLSGSAAQEKYFENYDGERTNTGAPAGRLLEKTNHLLKGVWYVNIVTQDGVRPHFKPDNPRKHFDKIKNKEKTIKYEQVINSKNGYFLPKMTYRHVKLIANINKVKKYPTGDLNAYCPEAWEWLAENKKIKKGVTEGAKKTLALLSVGVPTIGLSSIWNFNNSSTDRRLLSVFNQFKGHGFVIYHDNDKKKKTKQAVNAAIQKLTKALILSGVSTDISRATWWTSEHKGIDDYLYANNGHLNDLKYEHVVVGERPVKVRANMILNREYLTTKDKQCPPEIKKELDSHRLIALLSHKGGGKTTLLSNYTYGFQMMGIKVLIPTHRVQLMNELSQKFEISNADNWHSSLENIFGLAVCIDSLHEGSSVKFSKEIIELFRDCILMIDEVDQVLDHLISAMTDIKNHRHRVIENLILLMQSAQKVIVSSADISQEIIDFLELNTGEKAFIIENIFKPKGGYCKIYVQSNPQKLWSDLEVSLTKEQKIMIFTGSQKRTSTWSTQTLEEIIKNKFPHLKVMRVDSETVGDKERLEYRCFNNFNEFIEREQPDVLLVSPVLETGIDITTKHFDSYWGINWGITSVNSFSQAMARIRTNIPRYIWSSNNFIGRVGNGSYFSSVLEYSQRRQLKVNELIFQHCDNNFNPYINDSCLKLWAARGAIVNTQGQQLAKSVQRKFAEDYKVIEIDDVNLEQEEKQSIADRINDMKNLNIEKQYQEIINAKEVDDKTLDEMRKKKEKTSTERFIERKNKTIRYIAPQSKQTELNHQILEAEDKGFFQKINFYWLLRQGKEVSHKIDKQRILNNEFILDLNKKCLAAKITYCENFGIAEIIDSPNEKYHNNHPLIKKVGGRIRSGFNHLKEVKATIKDFWNMGRLSANSSDWNLCKWALELFGFRMKQNGRTNQHRNYQLVDLTGEVRQKLIDSWNVERISLLKQIEESDKCLNNIDNNITEHLSPQHLSPQHLSPQHLSPQHLSPQHLSPPEKSALPETSSNLLVEDYQEGHKHFRLNQLIRYFSLTGEVTGCYLGKIKDAVDEILIEFSNGIREIVSPRYCLAVK